MTLFPAVASDKCPEFKSFVIDWVAREAWGESDVQLDNCLTALCFFENSDEKNFIIKCAVLFSNYDTHSNVIELSVVNRLTRVLPLWVVNLAMNYAFHDIGCQMLIARVDEDNEKSHRFLEKSGWDKVFIPRLGGRNKGKYLFTLTDDAWQNSKMNKRRNDYAST